MTNQRNNSGFPNSVNAIIGIVGMVLALFLMLYLARIIYRLMWFVSPIFIIGALIVDRKVVINFGKWLIGLYKQNTVYGIGASVLTAFAFPLVSLFLLGRAFFSKKVREMNEEQELKRKGEYVDFEELDSKPLELRELDKQEEKKDSDYENLFGS